MFIVERFQEFIEQINFNFIEGNRWAYLVRGLGSTLLIALLSVVFGVILGFIVAIIRSTNEKNGSLKILNVISKFYLTVVRGTPVLLQLMLMHYVFLMQVGISNLLVSAVLTFGLNSGAYVAEIVRAGIMSIDQGQFEAGRSLGFNYIQTMLYIILPQAFKNVLPSLANEFIVLLKETSVCGFIGVADLTKGANIIQSITYEPFYPLMAAAIIYLILVMILTSFVGKLERRLRVNER